MEKQFIASYSGGKDSMLAIHRAVHAGMTLKGILTTYNPEQEKSFFHHVPKALLEQVAKQLDVPLFLVETSGENYNQQFEQVLSTLKTQGIQACVFGDIDLPTHRQWGEERCRRVGIASIFPLWQDGRRKLVEEFLGLGYQTMITVVNQRLLSKRFIGHPLSLAVLDEIEKEGGDPCGENGEYHSFVFDGPLFLDKVEFGCAEEILQGDYCILPLTL